MSEPSSRTRLWNTMTLVRDIVLAVWIVGASVFFAFRWGFAFYRDNQNAIASLLDTLSGQ